MVAPVLPVALPNCEPLLIISAVLGLLFAWFRFTAVQKIKINPPSGEYALMSDIGDATPSDAQQMALMYRIYGYITEGAKAFLLAEYKICGIFIVIFGLIVMVLTSSTTGGFVWKKGIMTMISFVCGGVTSMVSGYIGMMVAVYANARTTVSAKIDGNAGWTAAFNTAFNAGSVMGFSLVGIALLVAYALILLQNAQFPFDDPVGCYELHDAKLDFIGGPNCNVVSLMECLSGFGLGGSCIAMFGRVGGGIYTKAADVGADLAGKVIHDLPEDDPRNPATIADNVGDNVGDVAGMGSDLFGSFAEGMCAALVVAANSPDLNRQWTSLLFPLVVNATGILVCMVTSFIATDIQPVKCEEDVEKVLKVQIGASTLFMTIALYPITNAFLPATFNLSSGLVSYSCTPVDAFICIAAGLWSGCFIGFITEYFTSHSYSPVREVADSCVTGAATNIIYGLALGYKSLILPILLLAATVYVSFTLCGMYGVALSALGMLGTLATCLAIDVYGPVCDNAGGIAEMSHMPEYVREKTDALDSAGNTTAAIGKGFAIGSAALVALALFGAFTTRAGEESVNILKPIVFAWIFVGAMIPYWFTAMTMKSVGLAAMEMVEEVKRQFQNPDLLAGKIEADHNKCIAISTDASLKEMVLPGLLVIISPIFCGAVFGIQAVCGLLTGSITSGVQLAISQSNTGGAWDNAKKYVEKGSVFAEDENGKLVCMGKGSEVHKAAVTGDTVGDPLKDTSGPALNIVMKLQAIISLVFADFFLSINNGQGAFNIAKGN